MWEATLRAVAMVPKAWRVAKTGIGRVVASGERGKELVDEEDVEEEEDEKKSASRGFVFGAERRVEKSMS